MLDITELNNRTKILEKNPTFLSLLFLKQISSLHSLLFRVKDVISKDNNNNNFEKK